MHVAILALWALMHTPPQTPAPQPRLSASTPGPAAQSRDRSRARRPYNRRSRPATRIVISSTPVPPRRRERDVPGARHPPLAEVEARLPEFSKDNERVIRRERRAIVS